MAIYEGHGLRTFLDPLPAAESKVAAFVESYPIQTLNMMAHIRYATQGAVSLENVHPFQRELWGIHWSFAHNGEVPKFTNKNNNNENGNSGGVNQHPTLGHGSAVLATGLGVGLTAMGIAPPAYSLTVAWALLAVGSNTPNSVRGGEILKTAAIVQRTLCYIGSALCACGGIYAML